MKVPGATTYDNLRMQFGVWRRERKERAAEKAALIQNEHGHGRFFLLTVPATATILAAITEWYWAMLFCIEATGHLALDWSTSTGSDQTAAGAWHFMLDIQSAAVLVGLLFATIPIVMLSMVWLPVQFTMRGSGRWRRGTVIVVGLLANILVIVSGTVVMNYNRQTQVREALVVEQAADANRAMLAASVDDLRDELNTLMNHRSAYVATAASVGAEAYERDYVRQARATNDPRLPLLERALGSARRADALRAEIREARANVAQAAPAAASAANVEDNVGRELNTFAQYVEVWRPPFVALICTLIGIFGAWWTLALLQGLNPRDVLRSGWADEGHRIEDLREEEPIAAGAPAPLRQKQRVYNAETGAEEVFVQPKGYWRKTGKKKRNADGTEGEIAEFMPDAQPDETGVEYDGGQRVGSAPVAGIGEDEAAPAEEDAEAADADQHAAADATQEPSEQPESSSDSDLTQDDYMALEAFGADEPSVFQPAEAAESEPKAHNEGENDGNDAEAHFEQGHYELPDGEGTMTDAEEEQQDAHVRLRGRLIAAE